MRSRRSPASTSSPTRFLAARTRDELKRFLRDLCTLGELEALVHRWQIVRLLDQGLPYLEIAERVHTSTATVTRVAQWLRHGAGGYTLALDAARSLGGRHERGRPPPRRRPLEGPDGAPRARAARRRRAALRGRRARTARPLAERAGRPLLVRPHDIPEYVQDGVVHAGITGANLVVEAQADVVQLAELGFARCTLEAAVPNGAPQQALADLAGLRVATAYPVTTRVALAEIGVEAELVTISGSVEAAPRLGLSDAVVDLVSTGSTASANGLRRIGRLLSSEAVLIANRAALDDGRRELLERLELMVRGVVSARRRRYVMLNAPEEALPRIRELLPGMGAPSVLQLAEPGQIAVHAAVDTDEIWDLLPPLKAAGASSILVVPVERLVP